MNHHCTATNGGATADKQLVLRGALVDHRASAYPAVAANIDIPGYRASRGDMSEATNNDIVGNGCILVENVEVTDLDAIGETDTGTDDDAPTAFNSSPLQITEGRARMDQVAESELIAVVVGNLLPDIAFTDAYNKRNVSITNNFGFKNNLSRVCPSVQYGLIACDI